MDIVRVKKANNINLLIDCNSGIAMELYEYFSFFVPGYKFMPAYKNRVWDGKIRLFNRVTHELPVGLYTYVEHFCKARKYNIEHIESEYGYPTDKNDIKPESLYEFVKSLELQLKGNPIEIRDYQFQAVYKGLKDKRAVLISPTGSGKSLIIYTLMKYYLAMLNDHKGSKKVLIVVPTTSLVEQMYDDFRDYGMIVENGVHRIYSGKDKDNIEAGVVVSTWQSIYKLPKKWFEQFGCVIGDECHGFKSKSLTNIMNKCINASYRFGTTGTLDGTQTHKLVLEGLFGPVYDVTTTKKLQEDKTLADLNISALVLKHPEKIRKEWGKRTYQEEIKYILENNSRNQFIKNLALDQKGNTLVLFQMVERHGQPLYDLIAKDADSNRKVFFVHGGIETDDRENIRKIVESQKNAIIVASFGTFSTGINIKNLHNIIFSSPSKSQIRVLQSIGRGLRKSEDGSTTQLFDIIDDISNGSRKNFAMIHGAERFKIYEKQGFKYKFYNIDIGE